MSELINSDIKKELNAIFSHLESPVKLLFFTQKHACRACLEQRKLLEAVVEESDKLSLEVYDLIDDGEKAKKNGINKVPATVVEGEKDYGIRFFGITAGYEFGSLTEDILMISQNKSGLTPEQEELIRLIDVPVHLEIMVTLSCPYCPKMVRLAHQIAMVNVAIRSDMVESSEFPQLVQKYEVSGVPKTIINEVASFEGALPALDAIMGIIKAVKPNLYNSIEEKKRGEKGEYVTSREVISDHHYEVIIVGAGPAAMSAALYAIRKDLDLALLGNHLGGQITNTATIENWLGISSISGEELTRLFHSHIKRYPFPVRLDTKVQKIEREGVGFRIETEDNKNYHAISILYCAGKEYRRLGVPGEDSFIGNGIAFCATCDAPLYRDKRVAVIGGGNSAFTAARDLLHYASEIHIINILEEFQADPLLKKEVTGSSRVILHPATQVKGFLGKEKLIGIRIESVTGSDLYDLAVEGVFLEIGLTPNSMPVKDMIRLNQLEEIPVQRDQSTEIAGFFAAGDVTDEPEKQIVIAAGAGARAALSAYNYLSDAKKAISAYINK